MNHKSTCNKWMPMSVLGALAICCVLWLLDFPKPMVDDLFYTGAGFNLVGGHEFTNPLLARQQFPSDYFFVYPPLHSYTFAGWLKVFGISRGSVTAFPLFLYFITAISAIAVLRKHQAPRWLEWMAPLGVVTALLPVGLRPEPLAIAFTMAGFAIYECGPKTFRSALPAFFLMFLGASVAPRLTLFSVALMATGVFSVMTGSRTASEKKPGVLLPAALGAALAGFVFLIQVHFKLGEFLRVFRVHSHRVAQSKINLLFDFLDDNPYLRHAQVPLVLLGIALLLFAWRTSGGMARTSLFVVGTLPFIALIGGLGAGTLWFIVFAVILYSAEVVKTMPQLSMRLALVFSLCMLLANLTPLTMALGMLHGNITRSRGEHAAEARAMQSTPGHPVLIDSWTARYIYDYRIPAGFYDIQFAAPFPGSHIANDLKAGDTYVIGPANVEILKAYTRLETVIPGWRPFALQFRTFYRDPCMAYVITEESCNGRRPGK